jgi:signal peptidase I
MIGLGLGIVGAAAVVFGVVVLWVRCRLAVVTVEGVSMVPTLRAGERVLVRRTPGAAVRTGHLVVFQRPLWSTEHGPDARWLIKRVAAAAGEPVPADVRAAVGDADRVPPGFLVALGDNGARSSDSRQWGYVRADEVLGVVRRPFGTGGRIPPNADQNADERRCPGRAGR